MDEQLEFGIDCAADSLQSPNPMKTTSIVSARTGFSLLVSSEFVRRDGGEHGRILRLCFI